MTASTFRSLLPAAAAGLLCLTLASCKSTKKSGDYSGVVDYTTPETNLSQEEYPFDEKGNYLADVVSGKRKGTKNKKIDPPKSYTETYETPPEPTPVTSAAVSSSSGNYEIPPTSDAYAPVYSSGNNGSGSAYIAPSTPQRSSAASSSQSRTSSSSKPKVVARSKPKAKPKTTAKTKAKPKSSTVSYTIRKGDTLYSLANRYGTSVAAIKKASGISSNLLRDGRTIRIPRK